MAPLPGQQGTVIKELVDRVYPGLCLCGAPTAGVVRRRRTVRTLMHLLWIPRTGAVFVLPTLTMLKSIAQNLSKTVVRVLATLHEVPPCAAALVTLTSMATASKPLPQRSLTAEQQWFSTSLP